MKRSFIASLSRSQGRNAWAVIFRHPARVDPNTGKPGLRVRQGLGTENETEAANLKDQLNQLLADDFFWNLSAKSEAETRFLPRVVEIFFHGMTPDEIDFGDIRESIIELPRSKVSDYRRALLLGTTGAGKTTLLRQLIGADPTFEKFPSTFSKTLAPMRFETWAVLSVDPLSTTIISSQNFIDFKQSERISSSL